MIGHLEVLSSDKFSRRTTWAHLINECDAVIKVASFLENTVLPEDSEDGVMDEKLHYPML